MKPSETFSIRVREVRKRKDWTQQDLSDRLGEIGYPIEQSVIARIENPKKRPVSLDEAVAISAALGTNPVHMIVDPNRDELINLGLDLSVWPDNARSWLRGQGPLREEDWNVYFTEVSIDELKRQVNTTISILVHLAQSVVDAVIESAEDLDDAARKTIADRVDAMNRELDRQKESRINEK